MADGKRMSEYTPLSELTSEEKATYLGNAAVTTFGAKVSEGDKINVNIPLSTLVPSVPVTDVTVNGSSVVNNGVAVVTVPTVPTAAELAGDGLTANAGKLDVSNKVPAPTATTDRGKVLSVATDSDNIVWSTPAAVPEISQYNGDVSAISATNDTSSGGYVFDVNLDTDTLEKRHTTGENQVSYIAVKNPVPATTGTNEGDVLTVDANGDIGWAAPSGGGGGGGNPYTKVSVTPGERYKNGKTSDYDWELYDQDVSITNNTYAVVSSPIGYTYTSGFPDAKGIDVFKIKLPANTDFPMAVVEFTVYQDDNYNYGAVNDVEVYVGNTKLTRLYSHPFRKDTLVGRTLYSNKGQEHITDWGQNYWKIDEIQSSNTLFSKTAFVADADNIPIVQINIFGHCYTVSANVPGDAPAAS